ncbi:hypothetical protein U1Q18_020139 [Sarracenia purpurea var. burkii]
MEQYYSKIKYHAGELSVLGGDYFASECCVGINLDISQPPELTRFTMLPTAAYFEFLPYDIDKMSDRGEETVDLSAVEAGRFVGFYNSSPQVEFVTRAPKIPGEILTEGNLISAIKTFQEVLRNEAMTEMADFACFLDRELGSMQLKVFVEVREASIFLQQKKLLESDGVLRKCCFVS